MFKKIFHMLSTPSDEGSEIAMEGLELFTAATIAKLITFEQGRIHPDIYLHVDEGQDPDTGRKAPRFSYTKFDDNGGLIGRCAMVVDFGLTLSEGRPVWQIDWAIHPQYRSKGVGTDLVKKSVDEFTAGMAGKMEHLVLDACVAPHNISSNQIAAKVLGNKSKINIKGTGTVNNYRYIGG